MTDAPQIDAARPSSVREVAAGFRMLFTGISMLRQERSLWPVAVIPLTLAILALVAATVLIIGQADLAQELVAGALPVVEAGAWYTWLWVGPAKLLLWLLESLIFLLLCAMALVVSLMLASLVSAPFLDLLSQRVEVVEAGTLSEASDGSVSAVAMEIGRSLLNELRRLLFLGGVWAGLFTLGLVIPGGQLIAPPLMIAFTIVFLPLEYAGHVLDRRQVPFKRRRVWLREHTPRMLGFGAAAFLTLLVPGLNFVAMPALVVAGTLLAVRYPPES